MVRYMTAWMDTSQARVFDLHDTEVESLFVESSPLDIYREPVPVELPADLALFFERVARALRGASEILILGPDATMVEFVRYLHASEPHLRSALVGAEPFPASENRDLMRYARRFFGLTPTTSPNIRNRKRFMIASMALATQQRVRHEAVADDWSGLVPAPLEIPQH